MIILPKEAAEHVKINVDAKILIATGLGGVGREYPDYYAKFGEENVDVLIWEEDISDLDSHIAALKERIPKDEPFIGVGHSMGGSVWIELLAKESPPNMQGLVLVGCARKLRVNQGIKFMMGGHWIRIWLIVIFMTLMAPIMIFVWRKKTFDTYHELWRFPIRDGAPKIHRQYNLTLEKLGGVTKLINPDMPVVFIRLEKDTLVDEQDLDETKALFTNVHEQIIETNSLHLTEKFDPITVERIALESKFLGLTK